MSATKDWLMDVEEYTYEALDSGLTNIDQITNYVKQCGVLPDQRYIAEIIKKFYGEDDE